MGWLWSSSPKPVEPSSHNASSTTPTDPSAPSTQTSPPQPPQPPPPPPPQQQQQQPKRQPVKDADLQALLDSFTPTPPVQPPTTPPPSRLPAWLAKLTPARHRADDPATAALPPRDPLSESLLPTSMSCRQAFDMAWACNSVGGQWNAVYRYGEMRACSDKWEDFWFCMRHRAEADGPVKHDALRAHHRRRLHDKYYAPGRRSSEDVWEARVERVDPGSVFSRPIEPSAVDPHDGSDHLGK